MLKVEEKTKGKTEKGGIGEQIKHANTNNEKKRTQGR